jgi:hypothetical protein
MNFNLVFALSTCAIVAARIHYPREQGATKVAANSFSLPGDDPNPVARAVAIQEKRESFLYGPSDTVGGGPFYPAGSLGNETAMNDIASLQVDIIVNAENINIDMLKATSPESMSQVGLHFTAL